jgi:hypothetical protein
MKKTLERLRQMKGKAVDRMEALNALAKKETRELTEAEKAEYAAKKQEAEELAADIAEVEQQLAAQPGPVLVPQPVPVAVPDAAALQRQGAEAERLRASSIRTAAARFSLDTKVVEALVAEGLSLEASNAKILDLAAEKFQGNRINPIGASVERDAVETRREGMVAGLLLRADPKLPKELAEKGRPFASLSLLRMAEECLQAAGVQTRHMSPDTIARMALRGPAGTFTAQENFGFENFDGGMAGTSDFPAIVANVANKTLRQGYEAAPRTFTEFCVQVSAQDFKPLNSVQLSDLGALQPLNENGEFHRLALSDNKETYSLVTFGNVVALTRKVIINDDVQAFTRVPFLLGGAAARLESDTVWNLIINNGAMSDAIALFHANHNNLNTTNALAVAGMVTARAAMRKQTGPKGTILNLVPKYVIVSAAQEGVVAPIVNPQNLAATDTTKDVPSFLRTMIPVVEPRLDSAANGTTTWYLVADPSQISTIEYAYLAGQQGVFIETRQGFDVDGVEIKARMDFGAAPVEFRGLQKNTA